MKVRRLKPDELQHHGIKGQKWGVRRFQNYDGTLINSKGQKGQYGGSGAGTNDPRAKHRNDGGKYSTGKSKGVHRRGEGLGTGPVGNTNSSRTDGEYGDWLKDQHEKKRSNLIMNGPTLYGTDNNGNRYVLAKVSYNKNKNLKPNQVGCTVTKNARGYDEYNFEFKDAESMAKFYNSATGKEILSNPTALQAFAKTAYAKGYLEYDEDYINSEQGATYPFTSFSNLSPEEQLDPASAISTSDKKVKKRKTSTMDKIKIAGEEFAKGVLNSSFNGALDNLTTIVSKTAELIKLLSK